MEAEITIELKRKYGADEYGWDEASENFEIDEFELAELIYDWIVSSVKLKLRKED